MGKLHMAEQQEQKAEAGFAEGESLLDQILSETKLDKDDETYAVARRGVQAFITELLAPEKAGQRVDKAAVDAMIAEIDRRITRQVNEILHAPLCKSSKPRGAS
jgi:type VI secretion system protein ImpC